MFLAYLSPIVLPYVLHALDGMSDGTFNPFPAGSPGAALAPVIAGALLSVYASLRLHPNGVNGPAVVKPGKPDKRQLDLPKIGNASGLRLLVLALVLVPLLGRADELPPVPEDPPAPICLDTSCTYQLRPGLAFSGTAWDFYSNTIARSYTVAGLVELRHAGWIPGLALGPGWQTGQVDGFAVSAFLTTPPGWAVGGGVAFASSHRPAWSVAIGKVFF